MNSYYYQSPCPLHHSYSPYPSYYYPYYLDQPSSPMQSQNSTSAHNSTSESVPAVGRRRRQRTIFSKEQVDMLDQIFIKIPYPDIQLREQLSQKLDLSEARIQVWFKNRRSRARKTTTPTN